MQVISESKDKCEVFTEHKFDGNWMLEIGIGLID